MGVIGAELGSTLGGAIGSKFGGSAGGEIGRVLGKVGGGLIPWFKNGGKVKKTGMAYVHAGEHVVPKGIKLTKSQKDAIKKRGGML